MTTPPAGRRSALIIAGYDYLDPEFSQLRAPRHDAEALAAVLRDPAIGGFDVQTLINEPAHVISETVEEFFDERSSDDLLLLHFSCHGVKDQSGELYFATTNTKLNRLGATAVAADFVNRRMNRSRSRRIVLLLDCCYAGAFERGMSARADAAVGIEAQLGGRGRAVITASSALEYAFEGNTFAGSPASSPSVFTGALVHGLRTGEADRDLDGMIGLDELYDYVYDKVRETTPHQTPGKWTFGVQGDLYIARRSRPVDTPSALPDELRQVVDHPLAAVRAGAVVELERLLRNPHAGLALGARLALERLVGDDSRQVAAAASAALAAADSGGAGVAVPPEITVQVPPEVTVPGPVVPEAVPELPPPPAAPPRAPTTRGEAVPAKSRTPSGRWRRLSRRARIATGAGAVVAVLGITGVVSTALSGSGSGSGPTSSSNSQSPSSSPPPSGTIVYQDDFSQPNSGWPTDNSNLPFGGNYKNDTYHVYSRAYNESKGKHPTNSAVSPNAPTNVSVEADGRQPFLDENTEFGLACRWKDNADAYVFMLGKDYAAIDLLSTSIKGGFSQLKEVGIPGVNTDTSNHLQAACTNTPDGKGVHLVFWINGHRMIDVTDRKIPLSDGSVGLAVGIGDANSTSYTEAVFDNFVVKRLP